MVTMSQKSSLPQTLNLSHRHWWTHLQRGELDVLETGFKDHLDPMEGRIGGWHRREKKVNGIKVEVIPVLAQLKRREHVRSAAIPARE